MTTPPDPHLTEAQRQDAAERALASGDTAIQRHLERCESCAADVARLASLIAGARAPRADGEVPADLWPAIQDRIERSKVVALPDTGGSPAVRASRPLRTRRAVLWIGAAAALAFFVLLRLAGRVDLTSGRRTAPELAITSLVDSSHAYQEQARILFNRLSLERSLLRPGALAAIEHDLHIVDAAIAELDAAVATDPNNPVLRRLLASSYREKVDILKRIGNAE